MKKTIFILVSAFIILLAAIAGGIGYLGYEFSRTRPSESEQEVIYEVVSGKAFNTIAKDLESKGLVRNANFFSWYAKITGQRSKIKVGEYLFKTNMLPDEVLHVLISGKSIARTFTVSEGLSIYEIAERFETEEFGKAADFMKLVHDKELIQSLLGENVESLEGYLFPETYMMTKYTDAKGLITNMVKRFLVVYNQVLPLSQIQGLDRNQIVTLASIVEKETGAPEERPLIASIFHNRLAKKMKLQTDPTIIYGKAEKLKKIVVNITHADLLEPTRYNTYVIDGLPPTPICNPGKEALLATVKPAHSNYFYFVSKNDGTHVFSEEYKDHQKAVHDFQVNAKAREGHSWRELNEKPKK
jgi:UPF0755 protein